jgi:hypothetical protein
VKSAREIGEAGGVAGQPVAEELQHLGELGRVSGIQGHAGAACRTGGRPRLPHNASLPSGMRRDSRLARSDRRCHRWLTTSADYTAELESILPIPLPAESRCSFTDAATPAGPPARAAGQPRPQ